MAVNKVSTVDRLPMGRAQEELILHRNGVSYIIDLVSDERKAPLE